MTPDSEERLIASFDRMATAFEALTGICQKWFDLTYPVEEEIDAVVYDPKEEQRIPESKEEYDRLPEGGIGRFERLIKASRREDS